MGINDLAIIKAARGESISHRDKIKALGQGILGFIGYATLGSLIDDEAEAKYINGVYVDDTTMWTPDTFKERIVNGKGTSLVYWRREGKGGTESGDRDMEHFCKDLKGHVDKFYQINLEKYDRKVGMPLTHMVSQLSPGGKFFVPSWSVYKNGNQMRILHPHTTEEYATIYQVRTLPNTIKWLAQY